MKKGIIFLLMGVALLIGLGDISYPYDELLKVLVCVMGVFGAYSSRSNKQFKWVWILGGVALMFNPFLQALKDEDEVWRILSRVAGLIFIIYFFRNTNVSGIVKNLSDIAKEFLKSFRDMDRKWKICSAIFLLLLALLSLGLWGRNHLLKNYYRFVGDGAPWQVALAIKAGAPINGETTFKLSELVNNARKLTPLMYASKYNSNPEVAKILIQLGATINEQDPAGFTALMCAADSREFSDQRSQIIKLLVESGADITLRGRKRVFEVGSGDVPVIEGTAFDFLEGNPEARKNKDFAQLEKLLNPGDKVQSQV